MFDTGATGSFIDKDFCVTHKIYLRRIKRPVRLELTDGGESRYGRITHVAQVALTIQGKRTEVAFAVTKLK